MQFPETTHKNAKSQHQLINAARRVLIPTHEAHDNVRIVEITKLQCVGNLVS